MRILALSVVLMLALGCSETEENTQKIHQPQIVKITDKHREAAVASSDLSQLEKLTKQILEYHKAQKNLVSKSLNPPISRERVKRLFSEFSCEPPEEVYTIWSIVNGTSVVGVDDRFIWYHKLMSAEDSIAKNRELRGYNMFDWDSSWFPILEFQDEWYFFECTAPSQLASPVMFYFTESGAWYSYINLTTMFEFGASVIDQGLHEEDENIPYIERNRMLYETHKKFNEGATFPYAVE